MKIKKIIMPILFVAFFFIFSPNVYAAKTLGNCTYSRYNVDPLSITDGNYGFSIAVKDNNKISIESNFTKFSISTKLDNNAKDYIFNQGKCYKYVGVESSFATDETYYSNDANTIPSNYSYVFTLDSNDKKTSCSYDLRFASVDESTIYFLRYKVEQEADEYTFKHYYLNSLGNFTRIKVDQVNSAIAMQGVKENGVVTYYAQNNMLINIIPSNEYFGGNNVGLGSCPEITYNLNTTRDQIKVYGIYENYGYNYDASATASYKYSNLGIVKEGTETDAGDSQNNTKECKYNGESYITSSDLAKNTYRFTYNLDLKITNAGFVKDVHEMCVQVGSGYQCGDAQFGVTFLTQVGNTDTYMTFSLDGDLLDKFNKGTVNNFTCPKDVYIYNTNGVDTNYTFTLDSSKGSRIDQGENENPNTVQQNMDSDAKGTPNGGVAVEGCEILGTNFYNYIASVFMWIQILGPLLALILSMKDIVTAIISGEEDTKKKALKASKTRFLAAVLLLLIPFIIQIILQITDDLNGTTCNL